MIKKLFIIILLLPAIFTKLSAQEPAIGEWRSFLPFNNSNSVEQEGNIIWCATPYSLFNFNKDDNSLSILNKINGLSDINIKTIRYSSQYDALVVAYENTNIDLIIDNEIINISDIKRKQIYGNKTINNILIIDKYAYLSCGFGIVVLDIDKHEIHDTYYIGHNGTGINVNDLTYDGTYFYAATDAGIYYAEAASTNLANYAEWETDTTIFHPNASYSNIASYNSYLITTLEVPGFGGDTIFYKDTSGWHNMNAIAPDDFHELRISNNKLLICRNYNLVIMDSELEIQNVIWSFESGTPEPRSAIYDNDNSGSLWFADNIKGLVKNHDWANTFYQPNGPNTSSVYSLQFAGTDLWLAPGSLTASGGNLWNIDGPNVLKQNTWYSLKNENPEFESIYDILYIATNPSDYNHIFAASWFNGLIEIKNGIITAIYNESNSLLEEPTETYPGWMPAAGIKFDDDNNLWIVNPSCKNLLKLLTPEGDWYSFDVSLAGQQKAGQLIIDSYDQKWILLIGGYGIIVYHDNETPTDASDDLSKKLTSIVGGGNLPSNTVFSIAQDLDGEIWIGTDKGIGVIYSPENIFTGEDYDAQVITIEQDSTAQHLLEFETVTAIAVDGANNKWIGTQNAGIFYFSEDGQDEIYHFTAENSPLLSDVITTIAINPVTGEVFFGTTQGVCSFKGYSTTSQNTFSGVYAYPNPVPHGYTGMVGIKGLTQNSWVKITDVTGNLVYETRSEGGQAVWNACNFNGEKVQTGIYIVTCINETGTEKTVTKIAVVN